MKTFAHALLTILTLAPIGLAQTGSLDQVSPVGTAGFNGDATFLIWQADVRAGISGQLEGYTLQVTGPQGASLTTRVRAGGGWNTSPVLFQGTLVKPTGGTDNVFVDVTSAGIQVTAGSLFVIEMQGTGSGLWINGSYVAPPGTPQYAELLYLGAPGCYADCGWRLGFQTYVLPGTTGTIFCAGDGTAAACPCANASAPGSGEGCLSSLGIGGKLRTTGSASLANDTLVLQGTQMPNAPALYFQGTNQIGGGTGVAFGDGLRCAGGTIIRLGTKTNSGGASQYPAAGDASVSVRGLVTTPGVRTYQTWYRNAAAFCTASTFNLTNGLEVTWTL